MPHEKKLRIKWTHLVPAHCLESGVGLREGAEKKGLPERFQHCGSKNNHNFEKWTFSLKTSAVERGSKCSHPTLRSLCYPQRLLLCRQHKLHFSQTITPLWKATSDSTDRGRIFYIHFWANPSDTSTSMSLWTMEFGPVQTGRNPITRRTGIKRFGPVAEELVWR